MAPSRPLRIEAVSCALVLAAVALAVSLFLTWREPDGMFFGALDRVVAQDGFARWKLLDGGLLVLAAGLALLAFLRATGRAVPRVLAAVVAVAAVLAAICVAIAGLDRESVTFGSTVFTVSPGPGPWVALAALVGAIVALAGLLRRTTL